MAPSLQSSQVTVHVGAASRRSSNVAPQLNTWVTLAPEQRGKRAQMAAATPALVSAVKIEDRTATVIYPCELALAHGFNASPLKRIESVPFRRLRPATATARLHELLMTAVRAAAASNMDDWILQQQSESDEVPRQDSAAQTTAPVTVDPLAEVEAWVSGFKGELRECRPSAPAAPGDAAALRRNVSGSTLTACAKPIKMTICKPSKSTHMSSLSDATDSLGKDGILHSDERLQGRSRSRSRSAEHKSRRLVKAKVMTTDRAIAAVAARTFAGKGQVPISILLAALEADSSLGETRSQNSWDAMGAIRSLEASQKVFIADELVFSLSC